MHTYKYNIKLMERWALLFSHGEIAGVWNAAEIGHWLLPFLASCQGCIVMN